MVGRSRGRRLQLLFLDSGGFFIPLLFTATGRTNSNFPGQTNLIIDLCHTLLVRRCNATRAKDDVHLFERESLCLQAVSLERHVSRKGHTSGTKNQTKPAPIVMRTPNNIKVPASSQTTSSGMCQSWHTITDPCYHIWGHLTDNEVIHPVGRGTKGNAVRSG